MKFIKNIKTINGPRINYLCHLRPSAEWSQRVDNAEVRDEIEGEISQDVRGLRERIVYEFWVRGATIAGPGEPSRPVTASPNTMGL